MSEDFLHFLNRWIINTIASIWLRKYARVFVLGYYLFLEAHIFPRASLSENCSLLGTDFVRGQISEHIFAPNEGYCLYIKWPIMQTAPSLVKVIQLVYIYARNLADEAISMKKINNSRLMVSFSSILIDHRRMNCSKEALNVCKELYSYISASSWNEKILRHSDESDNVGDNIKN